MPSPVRWSRSSLALLAVLLCSGCSLRALAINKLGDALASGGDTYASDDDPDLIGDALPFSLKLIESLLAESPKHPPLLLGASRGFTQYSYGWVEAKAAALEEENADDATAQRARAARLYLRAKNYGLRGLDAAHPGFSNLLATDPDRAMSTLTPRDVPQLYWTAAPWALYISLSKDRPDVVADLPLIEKMIDRALALDESYDHGAIHNFLISYEPSRAGGEGDPYARSKAHFDRAVQLSGGKLASPYLAYAQAVSVPKQDRKEFEKLLQQVLAIDLDAMPNWRVENRLAQRRAAWLLAHEETMFIDTTEETAP